MARKDLKYPDLAALVAAYRSGELTKPLVVDNDVCFVYVDETMVFESGGPHELAEEAFRLLGIPFELC